MYVFHSNPLNFVLAYNVCCVSNENQNKICLNQVYFHYHSSSNLHEMSNLQKLKKKKKKKKKSTIDNLSSAEFAHRVGGKG